MRSLPKLGSFGFVLLTILLCSLNGSAQLLDVNPNFLSFTYQIGGPNPPAQNLFVTGGTGGQFIVNASGTPWLTVQPLSGIVPSALIVSVAPPANAVPGSVLGLRLRQQIAVRGTGLASNFRATASMNGVVRVDPASGYTDANITVPAIPGALAPGFYLGTITIDIPGVDGSQQILPVAVVMSSQP